MFMTIVVCPLFNLIEVVEKTSPPAPVEILPSNAGQDIAPTQLAGQFPAWLGFMFCATF